MTKMSEIANINKINWQKTHTYFFYLFLFSIPFQTRKVFLTDYSFYSGDFTEYATFFIYASDLFLILTLFFWFVFNKKQNYKWNMHFPLERGWDVLSVFFLKHKTKIQLFLGAFIIWLIVSAIINEILPLLGGVRGGNGYLEISAFQIIKFIELFLLIVYIYFNLANKKVLIISLFMISLTGFLQSLIAIYQFIFQHPLFNSSILAKITGEAIIGPQISGIAKIVVDGEKMIRAYGTFPHPNVLGGFLILSIMTSVYLLLEHEYAFLSRYKDSYSQLYNTKFKKSQIQLILSLFWIVIIFSQITALMFTFSRSAWAGFAISMAVLILLFYVRYFAIVSRETIVRIKKNNAEKVGYNYFNVSRETFLNFKGKLNCYLLAIFTSFLFIGLFDHYFWTLQQGKLIFWLVLGMLLIDIRFKAKDN